MHVAHQCGERRFRYQIANGPMGSQWRWVVILSQDDPGNSEDSEGGQGQPPQHEIDATRASRNGIVEAREAQTPGDSACVGRRLFKLGVGSHSLLWLADTADQVQSGSGAS